MISNWVRCFFSFQLLLVILIFQVKAQELNSRSYYRFSHPTPAQSSLINSINSDVNESSGEFRSNYHIESFEHGDLVYKLGFSYNSGSVKIPSNASEIGLGWQISSPPSISRIMKTLPDDGYSGVQNGTVFLNTIQQYSFSSLSQSNNPNNFVPYIEISSGCLDTEPDQFFFSFNGIEVKFSYNWSGLIEISASEKVKITPTRNSSTGRIEKFELIDSKGVVFILDQKEETTIDNFSISCVSSITFTSTWFASKMIDSRGNEISFDYEGNLIDQSLVVDQIIHKTGGGSNCSGNLLGQLSSYTTRTITGQLLLKTVILAGQNVLSATYLADRSDIVNQVGSISKRLTQLRVSLASSTDFRLIQDYSTGRLTLKEIEEISIPSNVKTNFTKFNYEGGTLPSQTSRSIDEWGYYNGKPNTSSLVPPAHLPGPSGFVNYSGADRNPDFNYSKVGILNEIINPFKGRTIIKYEPNTASFVQNAAIFEPVITNISVGDFAVGNCDYSNPACTFTVKNLDFNITNFATPVLFLWDFTLIPSSFGANKYPLINIFDSGNNLLFSFNTNSFGNQFSTLLNPGLYRAEIKASRYDPVSQDRDIADLTIQYAEQGSSERLNRIIGGARVKELEYRDVSDSTLDLVKFEYLGIDSFSSGVLNGNSSFYYEKESHVAVGSLNYDCNFIIRTTSNVFPIEIFAGNHVLYRRVRKFRLNLGSVISTYRTYYEHGFNQELEIPFIDPLVNNFYYGKVDTSQVYKSDLNVLNKLSESFTDYVGAYTDIPYIKVESKGGLMVVGDMTKFSMALGTRRLGISKSYFQNFKELANGEEFVKSTEYLYSSDMLFLKEKRESRGASKLITKFKYPHEFSGLSGIVSKHFYQPVEVVVTDEGYDEVKFLSANFLKMSLNSQSKVYVQENYILNDRIGKVTFVSSIDGLTASDPDLKLESKAIEVNNRGLEVIKSYDQDYFFKEQFGIQPLKFQFV